MINKPIVSLIAPCYNGERFVERFLKSVLSQTYTNIQFIFVDDGSIDNTVEIVSKYKFKLEQYLAQFIFVRQKNGGAASAVNKALKYVEGEFLSWADCDDVLHPENIEMKVKYLLKHEEKGLVLCAARAIDDVTNKPIRQLALPKDQQLNNLFERLIFEGIPCYSGVFMLRTNLLLESLGESRTIYFDREVGQNWQLLLPVAYDNACGYISACLYDYYVRSDSHSNQEDYARRMRRTFVQEEVLRETLKFIENNKRSILYKKIHFKYIIARLNESFGNFNSKDYLQSYQQLCMCNERANFKWKLKKVVICNKNFCKLYHCLKSKIYNCKGTK